MWVLGDRISFFETEDRGIVVFEDYCKVVLYRDTSNLPFQPVRRHAALGQLRDNAAGPIASPRTTLYRRLCKEIVHFNRGIYVSPLQDRRSHEDHGKETETCPRR